MVYNFWRSRRVKLPKSQVVERVECKHLLGFSPSLLKKFSVFSVLFFVSLFRCLLSRERETGYYYAKVLTTPWTLALSCCHGRGGGSVTTERAHSREEFEKSSIEDACVDLWGREMMKGGEWSGYTFGCESRQQRRTRPTWMNSSYFVALLI